MLITQRQSPDCYKQGYCVAVCRLQERILGQAPSCVEKGLAWGAARIDPDLFFNEEKCAEI